MASAVAKQNGLQEVRVHMGAFDLDVLLICGPHEGVEPYLRWKHADNDFKNPFLTAPRGAFFFKDGRVPVIWIPRKPVTPREYGTLSHECLHAVNYMLSWADIELNGRSEEVMTHHLGFLVTSILSKLK